MTDTPAETPIEDQPESPFEGFAFTPISTFDDYTDRQLVQFLAARFNDMCAVMVQVGGSAPAAFEKLASPMVQLAVKAMLR